MKSVFRWTLNPFIILSFIIITTISYLYWDQSIAAYFHQLNVRQYDWLTWLSLLGKWQIIVAVLLLLYVYFRWINPRTYIRHEQILFLLIAVLFANAICLALKILLGRARPDLLFTSQEYGFYWLKFHRPYWSFPSGHTTTIVSLMAGLSFLIPRHTWLWLSLGVIFSLTRVFLYHHYVSDVLFAAYLAVIEAGVIYYVLTYTGVVKLKQ